MPTAENALETGLRDRIAAHGPVTFAWFMEQALYDPNAGYYGSGRAAIGRRGDFFTNVSVGPLFGMLLARQFVDLWQRLNEPRSFTVVEQGAHDGTFARDALDFLAANAPRFYAALRYIIVEPFTSLRSTQRQKLESHRQVTWHCDLGELEPFTGVHFSNELLDAMPVHLIEHDGRTWCERHVTWTGGRFAFVNLPLSSPALAAEVAKVPAPRVFPFRGEISLRTGAWLTQLASRLERGYLLTVDYGLTREERMSNQRRHGSLACYSHHSRLDDPLQDAGAIDISSHVDFTSLLENAAACGLDQAGFTDQHRAMVRLAALHFQDATARDDAEAKQRRQFATLMHPELMGRSFHFICFSKGVENAGPPVLFSALAVCLGQ